MNHKGITPLVATILLLSFAVTVGVVVMSFGRAQVELEAECPLNINMKLAEIGGKEDLCIADGEVRFTVENGVNIKVSGLLVNVIGTESAATTELAAEIAKGGTYLGKVSFPGSVRQVKITPKITLQGEEQICVEKSIVKEELPAC